MTALDLMMPATSDFSFAQPPSSLSYWRGILRYMDDQQFNPARSWADSRENDCPDMPGRTASSLNEAYPARIVAGPLNVDTSVADAVWLSVAEAVAYCASRGLHRNIKTVRRWAHRSVARPETAEVLAQKQDTETDFRYVIERGSLDVKIAQELAFEAQQTRPDMGGHDRPGPDMPGDVSDRPSADLLQRAGPNTPGDDRTGADMGALGRGKDSEVGGHSGAAHGDGTFLKEQIAEKDRQIGKLHVQLERRDEQIMAMLERDRETNILIKGLQEALLPASALDDSRSRRLEVRSERYAPQGDKEAGKGLGDGVY